MKASRIGIYLAAGLALGAQGVAAQTIGLPAETAARQAADAELAARIDAEAVARMAADEQLRNSLSEGGLSGRYAVVGTGNCLRASAGFRPDLEFVPNVVLNAIIQPQTFTYTGIRTFNGGSIHGTSTVYSVTYPALVVGGAFINTGGSSVSDFEQDWSYEIGPDRTLTITGAGSHGTWRQGGSGVGSTLTTVGAPPLTGRISKDWKTIVLANAGMAVENSITTSPSGVTTDTPRICMRTETLTKMVDE